jgi:hypothetical protein
MNKGVNEWLRSVNVDGIYDRNRKEIVTPINYQNWLIYAFLFYN